MRAREREWWWCVISQSQWMECEAGAAERWQWHGRAEQADPGDSGSVGEIF